MLSDIPVNNRDLNGKSKKSYNSSLNLIQRSIDISAPLSSINLSPTNLNDTQKP